MNDNKKNLLTLSILSIVFLGYGLIKTQGLVHPDSLYQFLEPGYKQATGYGITVWEYQVGYRPYLHSLTIASIIKALKTLGIYNPVYLLQALDISTATAFFASVILTYFLGTKTFSQKTGFYAALFTLFSPLTLLYATRFNIHPYVTFLLLISYLLIASGSKKKILLSGGLIAIAFCLRYTVILLLPIFLYQALRLGRDKTAVLLSSLTATTVLWGLVDVVGWGDFMHSLKTFIVLGVLGGYSNVSGMEHPLYYVLFFAMHVPALFTSTYIIWDRERKPLPLLFFIVYLLCFSFIAHKELRYLVDIYPFFMVYAGRGLILFSNSINRGCIAKTVLIIFSLILALTIPPALVGWGSDSPHRALYLIGKQNDAGAVAYAGFQSTDGFPSYFFLDKKIPQIFLFNGIVHFPQLKNNDFSSTYSGLKKIDCTKSKINLSYYGFQCVSPEKILNNTNIDYVVAPDKSLLVSLLTSNGFQRRETFNDVSVFTRR